MKICFCDRIHIPKFPEGCVDHQTQLCVLGRCSIHPLELSLCRRARKTRSKGAATCSITFKTHTLEQEKKCVLSRFMHLILNGLG